MRWERDDVELDDDPARLARCLDRILDWLGDISWAEKNAVGARSAFLGTGGRRARTVRRLQFRAGRRDDVATLAPGLIGASRVGNPVLARFVQLARRCDSAPRGSGCLAEFSSSMTSLRLPT
jgi:hypothetical protein